ncbi:hypothetical protein E4V01_18445 [Methylorubrum sp. Q1]|uniref:hypothetical protein n=1 Tax=Methylorubrum sp. Q1 TaxID=2562453 RepID=UPI0010760939|nr:hypothetical protein [Methylorubrum sp. Q1]TFZ56557.1 hypothetical protein E4V01_18445 [Methylorubrum sp. Q1]
MRGINRRRLALGIASVSALGLAGCGSSGLGVVESARTTGAAAAGAAAETKIVRPTVSPAEMRRFLAKQLVENLAIGAQLVGSKREIIKASIFGPIPDSGFLASPEDDFYCVSVVVKNFDFIQKEKSVTAIFRVHQIGSVLSAKFKTYPVECKEAGVPFPEAVEMSTQRVSS